MASEVSTLARLSLAQRRLRGFLLATGVASTFSSSCCSFLCSMMTSANSLAASARTLTSAGRAFFHVAQIDDAFEFDGAFLELVGQIHDYAAAPGRNG